MPAPLPPTATKDLLGQLLSVVCVVHCLATPFVVSALPAAASFFGGFHPVLLVAVVAVAASAFVPGLRRHREPGVLVLALLGIAALAIAALALDGSWAAETALSALGASLMVGAHAWNGHLLRARVPATP